MTSPLTRISIPVPPSSATHDYVPIAGRDIQVGDDILALFIGQGGVFTVSPPEVNAGWWFYLIVDESAGSLGLGGAQFPEDPETLADTWFERFALWKVANKPADAATVTVGAAAWIYPAGEDGKMVCYTAGSGHVRGDRAFRGELLSDPLDLWISDDPEWDWLPVADGADVIVGDTVRYLATASGVVTDVLPWEVAESQINGADIYADATNLGRWFELNTGATATLPAPLNFNVWFKRLPKPTEGTTFLAADGSRWVYTDGIYYCWGRGESYSPGAIFLRGEIVGGLTEIE